MEITILYGITILIVTSGTVFITGIAEADEGVYHELPIQYMECLKCYKL